MTTKKYRLTKKGKLYVATMAVYLLGVALLSLAIASVRWQASALQLSLSLPVVLWTLWVENSGRADKWGWRKQKEVASMSINEDGTWGEKP